MPNEREYKGAQRVLAVGADTQAMSDDDRRYSRDEVALVLRKVAERSAALGAHGGLTRAELAEVVSEAGLDIAQVDRALAELSTQHKHDSHLLGLQHYALARRQVPGVLTEALLQRANKLINRDIGIIGASDIDEQGLSWFGRQVSVNITQERSKISVQIEERFHVTARARLMLGAMATMMAAMATLVSFARAGLEPVGVVVAAMLPLLAYAFVRKTHAQKVLATQQRLELLGDQLELMLGEGSATPDAAPLGPNDGVLTAADPQ